MDIYLPFVWGKLHQMTAVSLLMAQHDFTLEPIPSDDKYAYVQRFGKWWQAGNSFLVVEHDMGFSRNQVSEIELCPHDWCVFPYQIHGKMVSSGLGFTRFSQRLVRAFPYLPYHTERMGSVRVRRTEWWQLDQAVHHYLSATGHAPHVHEGHVEHYHEYPPLPHHASGTLDKAAG